MAGCFLSRKRRTSSSDVTKNLVISCEHATGRIPVNWSQYFQGAKRHLSSHRGYDIGALEVAQLLASRWRQRVYAPVVSRLLIDNNRSPHHPRVFSSFVRSLNREQRQELFSHYYWPHRIRVEEELQKKIDLYGKVVHIAVHSFTPVWNNIVRNADVGLLYDSKRHSEKVFCQQWLCAILELSQYTIRVRRNYPYRGRDDGLTTWFRKRWSDRCYIGVELEINQAWVKSKGVKKWEKFKEVLVDSLDCVC